MAKAYPILIFADGAASGNPGPGGWGVIIAHPEGKVQELGGGERGATNNQMELTAVIRALEALRQASGDVEILTDSTYVIRGITQWIWGWRKRGWKTAEGGAVANVELWQRLSTLVVGRKSLGELTWKYVRGHSGVPGNERVDAIAVAFTQGVRPRLYSGPLLQYNVAIHDIPENTGLPEMRPREVKEAAYSYLSLVGSTPMRHASWAECERRVKGQSGAKFKKAKSAADEAAILRSWGVKLSPKS